MARKSTAAPKAPKVAGQAATDASEMKKLLADIKKAKMELSSVVAKPIRLIRKHEANKLASEQRLQKTRNDLEILSQKNRKRLDKAKKDMKKSEEKLANLQNQLAARPMEKNIEKKLKTERTKLLSARQRCINAGKRQIDEAVANNGGEPLNWQVCEICIEPFDFEAHRPKVLKCGHTICQDCCNNIQMDHMYFCPFDRVTTTFHDRPDNLTIIDYTVAPPV